MNAIDLFAQRVNFAPTCDARNLKRIAQAIRATVVELSHRGDAPHLGSSLSCADILAVAYWGVLRVDPRHPRAAERDRFILSKGHAATTLYASLALRGFFPAAMLDFFNADGGVLAEHPGPECVAGVEAATGSLGHGLPIGVGMALAARIQKLDYRVFVTLSDGECNEGSVWEAAMFAAGRSLDRLCSIIDYNKWQATDRSDEVLALAPLVDKWRSCGWQALELDGHDTAALLQAMGDVPARSGRPTAIIAHTVKGKGVSFMEDDNNWHYRVPTSEEVLAAFDQLQASL
jgi:transketolase